MRDKRGQVLIELALVLPLLLVFTFAIVDYGRAIYTKNALLHAARSGARRAAVTPGLMPETSRALTGATSNPASAVKTSLGNIDQEGITYQLDVLNNSGGAVSGAAQTGNQIKLTLIHPQFKLITPFAGMMAVLTGATWEGNTLSLRGEASMQYE